MKYRSRADIISHVLRTTMNGGVTKTRIMYGAYLSYSQINEYLDFLQSKELLGFEQQTQRYNLTEKGLHFLHSYDQISEALAP